LCERRVSASRKGVSKALNEGKANLAKRRIEGSAEERFLATRGLSSNETNCSNRREREHARKKTNMGETTTTERRKRSRKRAS